MKKPICILMLLLCCATVYGIDIDFTWSAIDIGFENVTNEEKYVHWHFSRADFLNLSWIETNTGLGLGVSLLSIHDYWGSDLPIELMWNPFSTRLGRTGIYGTLSFYNKMGWGNLIKRNLEWRNFTGIRYMFSFIPYGRTREKGELNFRANGYVYAEYASNKVWRIGLSFDIGLLVGIILYPMFMP
jgi:hypothetical protein